ncbi:hypothetical protein B0H16DRAFT_1765446 [Mycena metata]|uniref:Uncharacterized protein n=1 Tax=Mycena metata TaxID=1033252 RepID=A0AAD7MWE9_9AGAR|nr:hypothetical protein B0H16DRAFT_1765446 [Mycena metata]
MRYGSVNTEPVSAGVLLGRADKELACPGAGAGAVIVGRPAPAAPTADASGPARSTSTLSFVSPNRPPHPSPSPCPCAVPLPTCEVDATALALKEEGGGGRLRGNTDREEKRRGEKQMGLKMRQRGGFTQRARARRACTPPWPEHHLRAHPAEQCIQTVGGRGHLRNTARRTTSMMMCTSTSPSKGHHGARHPSDAASLSASDASPPSTLLDPAADEGSQCSGRGRNISGEGVAAGPRRMEQMWMWIQGRPRITMEVNEAKGSDPALRYSRPIESGTVLGREGVRAVQKLPRRSTRARARIVPATLPTSREWRRDVAACTTFWCLRKKTRWRRQWGTREDERLKVGKAGRSAMGPKSERIRPGGAQELKPYLRDDTPSPGRDGAALQKDDMLVKIVRVGNQSRKCK